MGDVQKVSGGGLATSRLCQVPAAPAPGCGVKQPGRAGPGLYPGDVPPHAQELAGLPGQGQHSWGRDWGWADLPWGRPEPEHLGSQALVLTQAIDTGTHGQQLTQFPPPK